MEAFLRDLPEDTAETRGTRYRGHEALWKEDGMHILDIITMGDHKLPVAISAVKFLLQLLLAPIMILNLLLSFWRDFDEFKMWQKEQRRREASPGKPWRSEAGLEDLAENPKWRGKIIFEVFDTESIDFQHVRWRRENIMWIWHERGLSERAKFSALNTASWDVDVANTTKPLW
ncbi:hypothetical protein PT974_04993 [Cladobotryum mycophilum]|uniref:Uncharacterized protein n=1 Tax=Cladobotryum mycophilum TaxID=491253 RepID=A0ABR0SRW5_9HYPO